MFVFCVSVKFKLTVPLLCVCVHFACKGHPRNDLYYVGRDFTLFSMCPNWQLVIFMNVIIFFIIPKQSG